ncbi:MAG: hypothetical protein ACRC3Y_19335 [Romboutsia sp.]|uniref:hypothetical protein n=1 Tax=Romboutsia sp. TaxID=1965302 RepID=UPI003F3F673F
MNKKLTVFAIVLAIVGIIGTVSSGIASVPYFINTASKIEKELNKETVIFNEGISIDKLNINIDEGNVLIKKYDKDSVKIVLKGKEKNNDYEIKNSENELLLTQNNKNNIPELKTLNDFMDIIIEEIYSYNINSIIVYIPNDVDINVSTNMGSLIVEDDIFLNDFKFKTIGGNISLPNKVKNLESLDIASNNYIQLSMSELLGIKNVKITSNSVNIYSNENDIFIDNMEEHIPNNLDIFQKNGKYGHIELNVDIPVAKNLNIDAQESNTNINLPIEKYKINLDLKSLQSISISNLIEKNIINENEKYKYENIRELKGNINQNLDSLETEYNVKIKSNGIHL